MGAGQIGGIATLLDIDFRNAAGFQGVEAEISEGQYVVFFMSHALMFCVGTLIEAHVALTPATCVFGERYKFEIFAGTHKFLLNAGVPRTVEHVCIHRGYNHTKRWTQCITANLALLVLNKQYSFHEREPATDFIINRLRYGMPEKSTRKNEIRRCRYFGWGSRRNGYLIPLLIDLRKVDINLLPTSRCSKMWNYDDKYLCVQQFPCKSAKYGALCPDDYGTVIECAGFVVGMMISTLVDRPCGVGFLDLSKYTKFLTCGVDDARDVIDHDTYMAFDFSDPPNTPSLVTVPDEDEKDK